MPSSHDSGSLESGRSGPESRSDRRSWEGRRVRVTKGDDAGRRGVVYAVSDDGIEPPILYVALNAVDRPWMPPVNWQGWPCEVALDESGAFA